MSEKIVNTSLILSGQRNRVSKFTSLNLNGFTRKNTNVATSTSRKRKKSDIEVAEILLDMRSESNSGESSESEKKKKPKVQRKPKKTAAPNKNEKEDDTVQEIDNPAEEMLIPPAPETKTRLIIVFNSAVDTAYLLDSCRRLPELHPLSDDVLLKLVTSASEKYKEDAPMHTGSEIYVAAQILRYLVESSMVLSFNLKSRTKMMFSSDTKKAYSCLKLVESKLMTTHSRDVNDDWESCLCQAVQLLGLNESDRVFMYPIVSECIHQKHLQGKHVKVYVAATVSAILGSYPTYISQVYPFDKVWQALFSRFGITRLSLYSAMHAVTLVLPSMKSTNGLIVTTATEPGSVSEEE